MKSRSLLIAAALLGVLGIIIPLHADAPDTPLEKQMQILARGTKQLSLQVTDPTRQQENVTLIETLKSAIANAKTLEPRKTSDIPAEGKEKFLTAYHAELDKLTDAFGQVEDALKAAQYDKAKSLLATAHSIKKEGHGKFKQD